MKKRNFILLMIAGLALAGCGKKEHSGQEESGTIWTCSMHPQVREKKPGDCPICGMKLVPMKATATPEKSTSKVESTSPAAAGLIHLGEEKSTVGGIRTEKVKTEKLWSRTSVFGEVQAVQDGLVNYTWFYGGRVEKVLIDFNTTEVRKGQPILEIFSEEALADQEAYLQVLRERWLSTFYERDVMSSRVGTAAERLKNIGFSDEDLKNLTKKKSTRARFTLTAPSSGTLLKTPPVAGERFSRETVLFRIGKLDQVWLLATVYEKDLSVLKSGQKVEVTTQSVPGKTFTGKLVYIGRELDPATRAVQARFVIENPKGELFPGASASAIIQEPTAQGVSIQKSAVIDTGKRKLVYVKNDDLPGAFEAREVTLGPEGNNEDGDARVLVLQGLHEDEEVATAGAFLIDAEAQLQGTTPSHSHEDSK